MNINQLLSQFVVGFSITFVVNAIVVYLWNLFRHGEGAFDWEITFFFAITLGLVRPLQDLFEKRQ